MPSEASLRTDTFWFIAALLCKAKLENLHGQTVRKSKIKSLDQTHPNTTYNATVSRELFGTGGWSEA